jgi:hypothetical protein
MSKILPSHGRFSHPKTIRYQLKVASASILVLGLCFFIFTSQSYSQKRQDYGRIWKSLDQTQRSFYLGGLQEGTHELLFLRWIFDGSIPITDPIEKSIIEKSKLTNKQRNLLIQIIDKRLNEIDLEAFTTDVIADVMTDIYNDPANTFIDFHDIAKVAVMKLRGKPEEDVRKALENFRRAVSRLLSNTPLKP